MIERTLATIQTIRNIEPHPNADKLEIATVLGWKVCVEKGKFQIGDKGVYMEVDSLLPADNPEFAFLQPRHFRIKTVKLRGVISQGIIFPLSILTGTGVLAGPLEDGLDVTERLRVKKYEVPIAEGSSAIGPMPGFLRKTDQTRIQRVPELIQRCQGVKFLLSEKLDGASLTVYHNNGVTGVCGRNVELRNTENDPGWIAARKYRLPEVLKEAGENIAVQGEILNKGNWYHPGVYDFRVFDVYNIGTGYYLDHEALVKWCETFKLSPVPQLGAYVFDGETTIDGLVKMATRKTVAGPVDEWAEGVVFNPMKEARDIELGRLSYKVINPEYDL